jgi:hypothetical protein
VRPWGPRRTQSPISSQLLCGCVPAIAAVAPCRGQGAWCCDCSRRHAASHKQPSRAASNGWSDSPSIIGVAQDGHQPVRRCRGRARPAVAVSYSHWRRGRAAACWSLRGAWGSRGRDGGAGCPRGCSCPGGCGGGAHSGGAHCGARGCHTQGWRATASGTTLLRARGCS